MYRQNTDGQHGCKSAKYEFHGVTLPVCQLIDANKYATHPFHSSKLSWLIFASADNHRRKNGGADDYVAPPISRARAPTRLPAVVPVMVVPEMRMMPALDTARTRHASRAGRNRGGGTKQHHNREGAQKRFHDFLLFLFQT